MPPFVNWMIKIDHLQASYRKPFLLVETFMRLTSYYSMDIQ